MEYRIQHIEVFYSESGLRVASPFDFRKSPAIMRKARRDVQFYQSQEVERIDGTPRKYQDLHRHHYRGVRNAAVPKRDVIIIRCVAHPLPPTTPLLDSHAGIRTRPFLRDSLWTLNFCRVVQFTVHLLGYNNQNWLSDSASLPSLHTNIVIKLFPFSVIRKM